jgi:ABC-type multidrug transport system fused ATPase/permease subunit
MAVDSIHKVSKVSEDGEEVKVEGVPLPGLADLPHPCDNASWWDYMMFNWPRPLITLGASRLLTMEDLPPVSMHDDVVALNKDLTRHWKREYREKGEAANLYMPLFWTFWRNNWHTGIWLLLESAMRVAQALVLGQLIRWFLGDANSSNELMNSGYFLSFLIVLMGMAVTLLHHHAFYIAWRLGLQLRMTLSSVIYDKATNLSLRALSKVSLGHVLNLSSQDIEGFQLMGCFLHFTYQPVVESLAVLYFGIREIGWSFLAGFALILLLIPMQKVFSVKLTQTRRLTSKHTDKRIKLVNQALTGARLMKINGWENVFAELIEDARKSEVGSLLITSTMRGLNEAIFFAAPVIIACVTFITYVKLGNNLSTSKIFVVLSYYNITQFSMTKFFALAVQATSESSVAMGRIANFMKTEDDDENENHSNGAGAGAGAGAGPGEEAGEGDSLLNQGQKLRKLVQPDVTKGINVQGLCATWDAKVRDAAAADNNHNNHDNAETPALAADVENVLQDINLEVNPGELAVVVGPVGCSKTSLLMAIMGELKSTKGTIEIRGQSLDGISRGGAFNGNASVDAAAIAGGATTSAAGTTGKVPDGTATFAYAAQEPWIMSNTLRNNVLFGLCFDKEWYNAVVKACSLEQDLLELPNGDQTMIGDKGVNLSGGQKARVGLARALYTKAHVLLLDDPLSAVDSHVGFHLFHQAVCNSELFEGQGSPKKTVILVTHQTQFLSAAEVSQVLVMDKGSVVASGPYADLVKSGKLEFVGTGQSMEEYGRSHSKSVDATTLPTTTTAAATAAAATTHKEGDMGSPEASSDDLARLLEEEVSKGAAAAVDASGVVVAVPADASTGAASGTEKENVNEIRAGPASLIVAEEKTSGVVQRSTFLAYGESMGGLVMCSILVVVMSIPQALSITCNYWLALWSRQDFAEQQGTYYMNIYIILVVLCVSASLLRAIMFFKRSLYASQTMHNNMLHVVLRAPVSFFDSNPIGRIINRFSKDTTLIDDNLPGTLYDFFQCTLMVVGAVVVVCSGSPVIFVALLPLVWYFHSLRSYFLQTSREIKRIEALSRSPVFSHLSETLDGLVTIRALNRKQIFLDMHKLLVNNNCRAFFAFIATSRWLGFRLDVIATVLLMVSTFGAVACAEAELAVDPNLLAVGIMYVIQLTGLFQWCVRQSTEVESQFVSVERVLGFTRLPSEPALHGPANVDRLEDNISSITDKDAVAVPSVAASNDEDYCAGVHVPTPTVRSIKEWRPEWPEKGEVVAYKLTNSYRADLPPVLRDVSFTIKPGSRVGVVGRTGAGKSTLVGAFLRLVDATSGSIYIDGLDIQQVGLHDLRPRISVIPQTPFLFSGTVRKNLDPWDKYTDTMIWDAVRSVGLTDVVMGKGEKARVVAEADSAAEQQHEAFNNLEAVVEEAGMNFSTGERQLLCLARAILQNNKILVMDEATANIDLDTDIKVQDAIYENFSKRGTTVITIAHRLHTVIENDQILVLARGKLVENGHPHLLLKAYFGEPSEEGGAPVSADNVSGVKPPRHSLASLVKQTGADMCLKLRRLAMKAHASKGQQQQPTEEIGKGGSGAVAPLEVEAGK